MMRLRKKYSCKMKSAVCAAVLYVLFGALKQLSRMDTRMAAEISSWEDGMIYCLKTSKWGPALYIQKNGDTIYRLRDARIGFEDVEITFKTIDRAFLVLTGQQGLSGAYSAHAFTLRGDIQKTMSLCRCADLAEAYLFPAIMTRRILKELPAKEHFTVTVYLRLLLGILCQEHRPVKERPHIFTVAKSQ
ncbi:hypothetical protein [Eisenbergiella porci]|uniref:hypothetical protein n=1 Tax=Eisenbergiella porci TaxID=2652274 RepID=UPI002A7F34F1|nr:hypothetical protein [Eisenbergiella porci]